MHKTTLREVIETYESVRALALQPMRASASFKIAGLLRQMEDTIKPYDETRLRRAGELGKLNTTTNHFEFEEGKEEEFNREMDELLNAEVELRFKPVPLAELSGVSIAPAHAMKLGWVVALPAEADEPVEAGETM